MIEETVEYYLDQIFGSRAYCPHCKEMTYSDCDDGVAAGCLPYCLCSECGRNYELPPSEYDKHF